MRTAPLTRLTGGLLPREVARWPLKPSNLTCGGLPTPAHVPSSIASDTKFSAGFGWRSARTKSRTTSAGPQLASGDAPAGPAPAAGQAGIHSDTTVAGAVSSIEAPSSKPEARESAIRASTAAAAASSPAPSSEAAAVATAAPPPPSPPAPSPAPPTAAPAVSPAKPTRTRRGKIKGADPNDPAVTTPAGAASTLPPAAAPPPATISAAQQPAAGPRQAPTVASAPRNGLLLVVDGNYLANRAFYGYARMRLSTKGGVPTSITYSVLKTLQAAVRAVQPSALAVVFDPRGPTFRSAASLLDPSGPGPLAAAAAQLAAAGRLDWQDLACRLLAAATIRQDLEAAAAADAAATPASFLQPGGSFLPPQAAATLVTGVDDIAAAAAAAAAAAGAAALGGVTQPLPEVLQAIQLPSSLTTPSQASPPEAASVAAAEIALEAFSPVPPQTWAARKAAAALAVLTEALGPELAAALGLAPDGSGLLPAAAAAAVGEGAVDTGASLALAPIYKAGRVSQTEEFYTDFFNLQRLLGLMRAPPLVRPWLEADDLAGLLVREAGAAGVSVRVLTGDRDLYQLVDDAADVALLYPASAGAASRSGSGSGAAGAGASRSFPFATLREADVVAALGVAPRQVADYKALTGDASDCLPGVDGIGPKTAAQLLASYGSLAGVHAAVPQMTPKRRAALQTAAAASQYTLAMARVLGTPGAPTLPAGALAADLLPRLELRGFDPSLVEPALLELEMQSMARDARQGGALWKAFGGGRA